MLLDTISNNCLISLYGEEFPICNFCFFSCIEFPVFNEIIFVWCDMLSATTIQNPFNLSSSLVAGKIYQFAASNWQLWKSAYIKYIGTFLCLFFPLSFPLSLYCILVFVPQGTWCFWGQFPLACIWTSPPQPVILCAVVSFSTFSTFLAQVLELLRTCWEMSHSPLNEPFF